MIEILNDTTQSHIYQRTNLNHNTVVHGLSDKTKSRHLK